MLHNHFSKKLLKLWHKLYVLNKDIRYKTFTYLSNFKLVIQHLSVAFVAKLPKVFFQWLKKKIDFHWISLFIYKYLILFIYKLFISQKSHIWIVE